MIRQISRDELVQMINRNEPFKLVDVLDKDHYSKEHIKGAISLPLNDIEQEASKLLKKDETIIVYCASFECMASTKAAEKLLSLGYKNVADYKGGLKDYKEVALPLEGSLHKASINTCSYCAC